MNKMITATVVCSTLIFLTSSTAIMSQQQPGIASPVCVRCRNGCLQTRLHCIADLCARVRGQSQGPNACIGIPKENVQGWNTLLPGCYAQEKTCLATCQNSACNP